MKKLFILCFLLISVNVLPQGVNRVGLYHIAENALALNISSGLSYYFGDAEQSWIFYPHSKTQANYFIQINVDYSFWEYLMLRMNFIHSKLSGLRASYTFKSNLFEPDVLVEFHPFTVASELDFYPFIGFGLAFSNIKAYDIAYKHSRDLSYYMPIIPIGMGVKYNFSNSLQIGAELGFRFALNENEYNSLDGFPYTYLSDKGNILRGATSKFADLYYTIGVTIGYQWYF